MGYLILGLIVAFVIYRIHCLNVEEDRKAKEQNERKESERRQEEQRKLKKKQNIEAICNEMNQDVRFRSFFAKAQSVLIENKDSINYVEVRYNTLEIHLKIKVNKWDIQEPFKTIVIKFSDYNFRISGAYDPEAILYWFVNNVSFMAYRHFDQRCGEEYYTKDIMRAFDNFDNEGNWYDGIKTIYVIRNNR